MIATMKKNYYIQPNTTVITVFNLSPMMQAVSKLQVDGPGGNITKNPGLGGESSGDDFSKTFGDYNAWED